MMLLMVVHLIAVKLVEHSVVMHDPNTNALIEDPETRTLRIHRTPAVHFVLKAQ